MLHITLYLLTSETITINYEAKETELIESFDSYTTSYFD